jgi:hypothetical protein
MKRSSIFTLAGLLIAGCQYNNYYVPPVVRPRTGRDVDLTILQKGRTLFAHRCLECHTLPSVWHYRVEHWTAIVNSMAHRASLKPAEREAILAYIRAAREQP